MQAQRLPAQAPVPLQPLPNQQHDLPAVLQLQHRRQVIGSLLGLAAVGLTLSGAAAAAEAPSGLGGGAATGVKPGSIAARMATEGAIQEPGIMPPWSPKQIYFPRWLFGEWEVRRSLVAGSMSECSLLLLGQPETAAYTSHWLAGCTPLLPQLHKLLLSLQGLSGAGIITHAALLLLLRCGCAG